MSAHNFWDNFTHGFMHGMFNSNPFWGGFCMNNWFNFNPCLNPFNSCFSAFPASLYTYPNVFASTSIFPLMQDNPMPQFNSFSADVNKLFSTDFWENSNIFNNFDSNFSSNFNNFGTFNNFDNIQFDTFSRTTTGTTAPNKRSSSSSRTNYDDLIKKYSKMYNLEEAFVKAVIKQESGFNPKAKSSAGARGLMQLMPGTAKDLGVTDPFDPEQNIKGGTKYLRQMLDKFNGNKELALAAYNAGPGNVKNGRIPQNGQTPKYVKKVMESYREYKAMA